MFNEVLDESKSGSVKISDVEYGPLRAVIEYLYTGSINFFPGIFALEVFIAADKYDVQSLKTLAEIFVSQNITCYNVGYVLQSPGSTKSSFIKNACLAFIGRMTKGQVLRIAELKHLPRDLYIEIIGKLCG